MPRTRSNAPRTCLHLVHKSAEGLLLLHAKQRVVADWQWWRRWVRPKPGHHAVFANHSTVQQVGLLLNPTHTTRREPIASHMERASRKRRRSSGPSRLRSTSRSPAPSTVASPTATAVSIDERPRVTAAKRTSKAVNCEPCRTSKLKCDRNRPCSSCQLRGCEHRCYQDSLATPTAPMSSQAAMIEVNKMHQSICLLEEYLNSNPIVLPQELPGSPLLDTSHTQMVPTGNGYVDQSARNLPNGSRSASPVRQNHREMRPYDNDIIRTLPELGVVEGLINYYFEYCQWINRHITEATFRVQWAEYISGHNPDTLILATCCGILAMTTVHIPKTHHLYLAAQRDPAARPHTHFFASMETALARYEASPQGTSYSLEYAELLFLRAHYLLYGPQDGEGVWAAKSRMMSVATAMGLHRDPSQWRMPAEVAERRRWLWWYIVTMDQWQALLLGRPPSIAHHHYDTHLPHPTWNASQDPLTNQAVLRIFTLTEILSGITNDALSLRPVSYSNVQHHDRSITHWMASLPPEWPVTDAQIEDGLRSPDAAVRRMTFQAVFVRTSCYFIRLHLHRPYAARSTNPSATAWLNFGCGSLPSLNGSPLEISKGAAESAEIAATTAEEFINLLVHCRCDSSTPPERVFATDGLLAFHTFQMFTATMFFAFHLIAAPNGSRASQCIRNITTSRSVLRATPIGSPSGQLARNATMILDALAPLWEGEFVRMPPGPAKETFKIRLMGRVRRLAFPYHNPESQSTISPDPFGPGSARSDVQSLIPSSPYPPDGSFGSSGTLMPDMSVSGRAPAIVPAWQHPQAGSKHQPPLPAPSTSVNPYKSGRIQEGGASWNTVASHTVHTTPTIQTPNPQHPGVRDAFLPYGIRGGSNNPESIEGVGQTMSWGASVGIDAGEWAGFMQSMTSPPRLAVAPTMMSFHADDANPRSMLHPENHTRAKGL